MCGFFSTGELVGDCALILWSTSVDGQWKEDGRGRKKEMSWEYEGPTGVVCEMRVLLTLFEAIAS